MENIHPNKLIGSWYSFRDFFPIHLIFSQVKYNLVVLVYWAFLFVVINGFFGVSFGLPYLFLSPEYLGETSYMSFLILGFSVGGFIMAFHTYSYIRLGPYYPFIATLSRPYFKFCVNNSSVPLLFLLNLSWNIWTFQQAQELLDGFDIFLFVISMLSGAFLFILLAFIYFFPTNKDLFRMTGKRSEDYVVTESNIKTSFHKKQRWFEHFVRGKDDTYTYIGSGFRIKQSRSCHHYDIAILNKVFVQNYTNATLFEVSLIITFIILGLFRDSEFFQVPAASSIMILITVLLMLISAFFSWFKRWTYVIIVLILFGMNSMSKSSYLFQFQSNAFGMSYAEEDLKPYSPEAINNLIGPDVCAEDKAEYLKILTAWKSKQSAEKPKLVVINSSGGGLRSAMWTFKVMRDLDSITQSKFSNSTHLITGASGGMVGASYYRELMLDIAENRIASTQMGYYLDNISKDLLNRIAFSISTSDIFFRMQKVEYNGQSYPKDRGYAFEQQLIKNLNGSLDKSLGDYYLPEKESIIPVMIFTPTIVNDGRRLLVSSQQMGFMHGKYAQEEKGVRPIVENVEYQKFFAGVHPNDIRFTSVLRMNATFPYIMPMVTMPTYPGMQVMDAGIRDNYGTKTTVAFIHALEDWIREHTSGVVLVKIRDSKKQLKGEEYRQVGMFDKLFLPFGNMYGNFPRVQDLNQDELLMNSKLYSDGLIHVVTFNLRESLDDKISLSWHLTRQEKTKILEAINSKENQEEIEILLNLLNF
jgi:hypothetical protein